MATIKNLYASSSALTITLASLANGSARESTAVSNTTNLYLDALVTVKVKTASSGTSTTGYLTVFAYGSIDSGTSYSDGVTGTDASFTVATAPNLRILGVVNVSANSTTYTSAPFSVAQAFGGTLPEKWGVVISNSTGAALDSTGGNHAVTFQGVNTQVV